MKSPPPPPVKRDPPPAVVAAPAPAPAVRCQHLRVKVVGRMPDSGDLIVEALDASGKSCDWRTYFVPPAALEDRR